MSSSRKSGRVSSNSRRHSGSRPAWRAGPGSGTTPPRRPAGVTSIGEGPVGVAPASSLALDRHPSPPLAPLRLAKQERCRSKPPWTHGIIDLRPVQASVDIAPHGVANVAPPSANRHGRRLMRPWPLAESRGRRRCRDAGVCTVSNAARQRDATWYTPHSERPCSPPQAASGARCGRCYARGEWTQPSGNCGTRSNGTRD